MSSGLVRERRDRGCGKRFFCIDLVILPAERNILPSEAPYESASSVRDQMETYIRLSNLQRCADPRRADCEPPPLHRRRSRGEKCCWGRACWSSRCWREPGKTDVDFMRQDRSRGRDKEKPKKQKTIQISIPASAQQHSLCDL